MFVKINAKWLVNLSKVKYLGISNESNSKIEVKYDDDTGVTFNCASDMDAAAAVENIAALFEPMKM